ncbi:MAG: zinc-ribbon domain-containing protein [Labilithrix sp.]|nr:zinc-ribbon domain-containing protein [Labilithrix sp.]
MDVRCERCNTEYEFDDALVSGRGTTVKCTNCGHKFKIRRRDGDFSEDFWNVQTGDGRTLVFTSLRELQRAIQTHLVERTDMLSRGGLPPKAIGQIPELAPFFDQRDQRKSLTPGAPHAATKTQIAGSSTGATSRTSRPPPPPGPSAPPLAPPPRARMSTRPDFPPATPEETPERQAQLASMKRTLVGTGPDSAELQRAAQGAIANAGHAPPAVEAPATRAHVGAARPSEAPPTEREPEPDTERYAREPPPVAEKVDSRPHERVIEVPRSPPPPPFEGSSPLPPPTAPVLRSMGLTPDEYSDEVRAHGTLSDAPSSMGRRRPVGGFIVGIVVAIGMGVIGAFWAKGNLPGLMGAKPPASAATDPRVSGLLAAGERALIDGNLDVAKESFDKASALDEKDPRVLLDVARLAAVRADTPWLKSRLLASDAADEHRLARDGLNELAAAARKAADDALAVAPDDPGALRAKIDALRISGDREGARAIVARVASSASQPETAYVLAALDLAEAEPLWSTVVERLRVAASAESGPGRARAALAYALARSGDVAGAKAEVERLSSMSRSHPLLPLLRAFADRATPIAKPELDAGPAVADGGRREKGEKGERGHGATSNDPRVLVTQAEAARARGDYDKAQTLYAAALDRNGADTEALSGLAAIAYARRDLNGARASYKRVLSINPSYVPALVGLGDVEWESGDRGSAMKTYKEIVDRFPEGTYPARVKQRLETMTGGSSSGAGSSGGSTPAPSSAPAPSDTGGGG